MDIDSLLNIEDRTGVRKKDVTDFVDRATEIEAKIRALRELPLEELERQEAEEDRQEAREVAIKAKKRLEYEAMERAREAREKAQEHEQWWKGAKVLFGEEVDEIDNSIQSNDQVETTREAMLKKYENDYSRWDNADFSHDPASRAEAEEARKIKQDAENKKFEAANPEFCQGVLEDISKRNEAQKKKKETANAARLRGNRYFKSGKIKEALKTYRESLELKAYEPATLLNIAQAYLKLNHPNDAEEFTNRALFVVEATNPLKAKILSRRAAARKLLNKLEDAEQDLSTAQRLAPENSAILSELAEIVRLRQDERNEDIVASAVSENTNDEPLQAVNAIDINTFLQSKDALHRLAAAMRCSPEARVLWRVRGGIQKLCSGLCFTKENKALVLATLSGAIHAEPKSKTICLESLDAIVLILKENLKGKKELRAAAAEALAELCEIETGACEHSARAVLKKGAKTLSQTLFADELVSSAHAAAALSSLAGRQSFRKALIDAGAVQALGHGLLLKDAPTEDDTTTPEERYAKEAAVHLARPALMDACALALSQLAIEAEARPLFAKTIQQEYTVVAALLQVVTNQKQSEECRAAALAAIANACHQCDPTRIAAESAAAVAVFFGMALSQKTKSALLRLRATQALARLIVAGGPKGTAASTLGSSEKTIPALAKELAHSSNEHTEALLRCIAGVEGAQLTKDHLAALAVAKILPEAKKDIHGQVTAETIIMKASAHRPSATAVANASKALTPCVNDHSTLLFLLEHADLTDRLVAALATYSEVSIRRNVAILLAKVIANHPPAKERARSLRGIEMLTVLGKSLV